MSQTVNLEILCPCREEAAIRLAADWLAKAVGEATAGRLSVDCHFDQSPSETHLTANVIRMVSLSTDIDDLESPWPEVERRLRERLAGRLSPSTVLMTVFRATGEPFGAAGLCRERIRRLNLLALELSRESGVSVADVDRALADIGAQALRAGDHPNGEQATRATAHTLAVTLASGPLDTWLSGKEQDSVKTAMAAYDPCRSGFTRLEVFSAPIVTVRVRGRHQRAEVPRRDANQVGGYVRQVLAGQISILEAARIVREAIVRRGWRHCASIVLRGLTRSSGRNAPRPA